MGDAEIRKYFLKIFKSGSEKTVTFFMDTEQDNYDADQKT